MFGIGMLLAAFSNEAIQKEITPLIAPLIPTTNFAYVVGFSIAAPLALYRGPLNVWGLGFGLAGLLKETTLLPGALVMGAFISTGAVQGVCDPTNTHNVWIANYLGLDVTKMSFRILPFIWVMVVVALAGSVLLFEF
ncbi:MAG: C4-dicarboxylate ABC transporter, partial [bacterium]